MRRATAALIVLTAFACLDPLYEDGTASGFFVCCQDGRVGTCACEAGRRCLPNFKPCAAGLCSNTLSCASGFGGGSSATGGGSSATGGGSTSAGGSAAGGSAAGGSAADAGIIADAGFGGGSAAGGSAAGGSAAGGSAAGGSAAGGSAAGGSAGGGFVEPVFELCCVGGTVTTCQCPGGVCSNAPFTACPANRCVAGSTTASCR
ncbi:MAG: hypothetical protein Q8N26_36965 [Myxococcales bacterium]|nr:hypothetical protein [Myxococcales bacterium]